MATDPFQLFDEWLAEARVSEPNDPEAMALATAASDGWPSVRIVLLKGHGPDGFVFYTNEQSARLLFYHDHSWGITRLNVYAGEAAGYLITDQA